MKYSWQPASFLGTQLTPPPPPHSDVRLRGHRKDLVLFGQHLPSACGLVVVSQLTQCCCADADATPNQESSSIFARTCRSRLNIAMAEPTALSLRGQLWKSMFLEDWMQKKIPETTKDVVLIVCRLMFFVFTSRNVNCGTLLAQLKEWFDYQQRKQRIDLKAGRRSRLKTRWYVWARQSSTWQNTSVLAFTVPCKKK